MLAAAGGNRWKGKKTGPVFRRRWPSDDQLRILAELDGTSNVVARFVYADGINVPELMEKGGRTYRLIKDQLGSVRLVVDVEDGSIVQEMRYDAWGNVIYDSNPGFQPFGFAGGLYDPQTRLVRFGARDYDASIGRWLSKDPLGFEGGSTCLYSYVGEAPTQFRDPDGLSWLDCCLFSYYLCRCAEKSAEFGDLFRRMQKRCTSDDPSDICLEKWGFFQSSNALKHCLEIPECAKAYDYGVKCLGWPPLGTSVPEVPGGDPKPLPPYRPPKGSGFPWPRGPWEDPADLP